MKPILTSALFRERARLPVCPTIYRIMTRLMPIGFAVWLAGCAEAQMRYNVITYDSAVAETANQSILLNAVRASQHYPMSFTAVGQLLATPPVSGTLSSMFNFSNAGLTNYSINPTVNAGAGYSTFTLDNLNNAQFMLGLRAPIPPAIVATFEQNQNWPREIVWLTYLQEFKPSASLVASIDSERRYQCGHRHSPRQMSLCDALDKSINYYTTRCGTHFDDSYRRMRDIRQDRNYYYNTAVHECRFLRFRIFLEETRLLEKRPCPIGTPGPACVPAIYRTALQMIEYLGELIRAQLYIEEPFMPEVLFGRSVPAGGFTLVPLPLFEVRRGVGPERAAVTVYHEGSVYYIPQPDFGSPYEARSLQVLDLVLQTVRAATLRDDLPKVPSFGIIKQ